MSSPTQMTLNLLAREGWDADIVERRITKRVTKDMFGIADVVAMKGCQFVAIQVTDHTHHSHRKKKVLASPYFERWMSCPCRGFEIWSWKPDGRVRREALAQAAR